MQTPFFLGPRLYFRPVEREDAPRLAAFVNHPEVLDGAYVDTWVMGILRSEWKPGPA